MTRLDRHEQELRRNLLAFLSRLDADTRRSLGRAATPLVRLRLGAMLEDARRRKQNARSAIERLRADDDVARICDALYANGTIDPLQQLDDAASDDES